METINDSGFKELVKKSKQTATTRNLGEGESDFESCHIIIFKMSSFKQKITRQQTDSEVYMEGQKTQTC